MTTPPSERAPKPRVGSPIIFRAEKDGPEFVARPCSGKHRALWLGGYVILSCRKCAVGRVEEPGDE